MVFFSGPELGFGSARGFLLRLGRFDARVFWGPGRFGARFFLGGPEGFEDMVFFYVLRRALVFFWDCFLSLMIFLGYHGFLRDLGWLLVRAESGIAAVHGFFWGSDCFFFWPV